MKMRGMVRIIGMFLLFVLSVYAREVAVCMNINVLVATRDSKVPTYAEINKEEIYLVFAQLAKVIPGNDIEGIRRVIQEKEFKGSPSAMKEQVLSIFDSTPGAGVVVSGRLTLILFNEMFFGRDRALEREGVDFIINCYKDFSSFFKNTYLYIDFLYKDNICDEYGEQIGISKARYSQISNLEAKNEQFSGFSSIWFQMGVPPNYTSLNKWYLESVLSNEVSSDVFSGLLFNQIKIFFEGEEVGFYNKSSFCAESLPDFIVGNFLGEKSVSYCMVEEFPVLEKVPYYVIGDFSIHWIRDHDPLLDNITALICYDTDAVLNLNEQPSQKQVCLFTSNTYNTLLASINDRKNRGVFDRIYVCSDPKGRILNGTIKEEEDISNFEIVGAFKTTDETFFPLDGIQPFGSFGFSFPSQERKINDYRVYGFEL